jgi:hypothetical protein
LDEYPGVTILSFRLPLSSVRNTNNTQALQALTQCHHQTCRLYQLMVFVLVCWSFNSG